MRDRDKTKMQLIGELETLRREKASAEAMSRRKLFAILNASQEGISVVDRDFRLLEINDAMLKLFDLDRESLGHRTCFEFFKGRDQTCPHCAVAEIYRTGTAAYRISGEQDRASLGGKTVEIFACPIHDDEGQIVGAAEFARDITERMRADAVASKLLNLVVSLNGVTTLGEALNACCESVVEISGMDRCGVYLTDEQGGLTLGAFQGVQSEVAEDFVYYPPDSEFARRVMAGNSDYYHARESDVTRRDRLLALGVRALMILPVHHEGRVIACLVSAAREMDTVPVATRRAIESVAANIGGALARLRAEEALRQSAATIRVLLDATSDSAFLVELDGTIVAANKTAAQRVKTGLDELIGRCVYDFLPKEVVKNRRLLVEQIVASRTAASFLDTREGRLYDRHIYPIHDETGKVYRLAIYSQDVTDRHQAEEKLKSEQRLLRRLLELMERERDLVSQEIHDGFVQDVVGAQMILDATRAKLKSESGIEEPGLSTVGHHLGLAIAEARRMIGELRPLIVGEKGIVEAINYLVAHEQKNGGIDVDFQHQVEFDRLDSVVEANIFRIVQESLTNAKRHSGAETVSIRLTQQGELLLIEIADQGVGFNPGDVPEDRFGITGILERARLFGGKALIDSEPGRGTRIMVKLPLTVDGKVS